MAGSMNAGAELKLYLNVNYTKLAASPTGGYGDERTEPGESLRIRGNVDNNVWTRDNSNDLLTDKCIGGHALGASASRTYDINASLEGTFDFAADLTKIHFIFLQSLDDVESGTDKKIQLCGGANPCLLFTGADEGVICAAGAFILLSCGNDAGIAVENGVSDQLKVTNLDAGNAVTYELLVFGRAG